MTNELDDEFNDFFGDVQESKAEQETNILEVAKRGEVARFIELKATTLEIDLFECLDYACYGNNTKMVKHLIQVEGAKPTDDHGHTTIAYGRFEALDELLSNGLDPHVENDRLTYHAAALNYGALEILAKHGAKDYTPILNQFIETDMTDVAIYLLEHGAKPDIETLNLASRIEDLTILKHLLTDKGMVPPNPEWIDTIPDLFIEAKNLLNKASLQVRLQSKLKKKSQVMGMKI